MLASKRNMGFSGGPQQQRGIAVVIVTIGMVAMAAMAGLALDMGDVYINKTRLQNSLDASALSAAKELVLKPGDMAAATIRARGTFVLNQDEGNEQLITIAQTDVNVEFSDTLVPWVPNSGSNFVRVWVDTFSLQSFLISVIGITDKPVVASATAGPAKVSCPNLFPLMACGFQNPPEGGKANNWGYDVGDQVILKVHSGPCPDAPTPENPDPCNGPGNFNVLDVGSGASAVRAAICGQGEFECIEPGQTAQTEPGNMVGPVGQAINAMFGVHQGPVNEDNCPADGNTTEFFPADIPPFISDYRDGTHTDRRVVPVPIGVCTEDEGGKKVMTILDTMCFLITRQAETAGNTQLVYGEFLDPDQDSCIAPGHISPDPDPEAGGPVIIVLYKDQIMDDG